MRKVFEGNKFLEEHQVTMNLSNGKVYTVREVMPAVMAEISKLEEKEDQGAETMAEILGKICGAPTEDFIGLGMVESKGALDFLLANLFDAKSPS